MLPFFSNRAIPGMPSEHRKQLRAGAAAGSDVEMLHATAKVRVERVAKPHAPAKREPLARGVGDGVAEARAAQELGGREGLPVVQHDALARLPHRHEAALASLSPAWSAAGWSRRDPATGAPAAPLPPARAAGSLGR